MNSSSYANRQQDEENFWQLTLVPLYREMGAALTRGLVMNGPNNRPEYTDIDRVEFDMDDVRALAEDQDALSTRVLEQLAKGAIGLKEARVKLGYPDEPDDKDDVFYTPTSTTPTTYSQLLESAATVPEPMPGDEGSSDYAGALPNGATPNGKPTNGRALPGKMWQV